MLVRLRNAQADAFPDLPRIAYRGASPAKLGRERILIAHRPSTNEPPGNQVYSVEGADVVIQSPGRNRRTIFVIFEGKKGGCG